MIPDDFALFIMSMMPSVSDLTKLGISKDDAVSFQKQYICIKRERPLEIDGNDFFLSIMKHWSLEHITVGMITFLNVPILDGRNAQIGHVESDKLLLSLNSGELFVADFNETVLWRAATNSTGFVSSLQILIPYLRDRGLGKIDFDDLKLADKIARDCAALSGGDYFLSFYSMLVGI